MKTKKGFTLVEVMIVVAIIGLLAAVGIPSILGAMEKSKVKAKDRNIQDVIRAKGMLTLPTDMGGANLGDGDDPLTSTPDIWAHLDGVASEADLQIGDDAITINSIGTLPSY